MFSKQSHLNTSGLSIDLQSTKEVLSPHMSRHHEHISIEFMKTDVL